MFGELSVSTASRPRAITRTSIDRAIVDARMTGKQVRLWDSKCGGFHVLCLPTGRASYRLFYRPDGGGRGARQRTITIGDYPAVPPEEARDRAMALRLAVRSGKDPVAERKERRGSGQMRVAFPQWLDDLRARTKPQTLREYQRLWTKEISPVMGARRVVDVTEQDVRSLHRALAGRPVLANRVRARLSAFFEWCEQEGYRERRTNPVAVQPYPEKASERYLTDEEMKRLLQALSTAQREGLPAAPAMRAKKGGVTVNTTGRRRGAYKKRNEPPVVRANPYAVGAIRLLMLTGMREQEALTLRWSDVDMENRRVHLRDTKTGDSVRALSDAALSVIAAQPRLDDNPYVFPGARPRRPLVEIRQVWYAVRHAAGLDDVRLHDLRHNLASVLINSGATLAEVGGVLGHKDVKSAARYAHLAEARRRVTANMGADRIMQLGE